MAIRAWHHSSLAVDDLAVAIAFFGDAFGFEVAFREDRMADQIATIAGVPGLVCDIAQLRNPTSGHVLELIAFDGAAEGDDRPFRPGTAHVAFQVDDLDAALATIVGLGARLLGTITDFSDCRAAYLRVPGGVFVELEEPR